PGARLVLEDLEDRTLMSVLPTPVIPNIGHLNFDSISNTPAVAIDPVNPSKIVAVWVDGNPLPTTYQPSALTGLTGAFTIDGGATWLGFGLPAPLTDPLIPVPPGAQYEFADEPAIAFDRNENFYVVSVQREAGLGDFGQT